MLWAKFGCIWRKVLNVSVYFRYYLQSGNSMAFPLNKLKTLYPRMLCAKFGWNWPSDPGEKDFKMLSMYFCYFAIISPWKKVWPQMWTDLNHFHQMIRCAMFSLNWPSSSGEEDENVKSKQTVGWTDIWTDNGRQVIRKAHFSLQFR